MSGTNEIATYEVEKLGRWKVCNTVSKHEYKNSDI